MSRTNTNNDIILAKLGHAHQYAQLAITALQYKVTKLAALEGGRACPWGCKAGFEDVECAGPSEGRRHW